MAEVMKHEFLLGFIKIYILQYAHRESVYGKEIHEHLTETGYHLSYATLYNTLHGLENKGYLLHEERNVAGKIRKYYNITDKGRDALMISMNHAQMLFTDLDYKKNAESPSKTK